MSSGPLGDTGPPNLRPGWLLESVHCDDRPTPNTNPYVDNVYQPTGLPTITDARKHRSPSRLRDAAKHPSLAVHLDKATYDRVLDRRDRPGLTLNQLVRQHSDRLTPTWTRFTSTGRRLALANVARRDHHPMFACEVQDLVDFVQKGTRGMEKRDWRACETHPLYLLLDSGPRRGKASILGSRPSLVGGVDRQMHSSRRQSDSGIHRQKHAGVAGARRPARHEPPWVHGAT